MDTCPSFWTKISAVISRLSTKRKDAKKRLHLHFLYQNSETSSKLFSLQFVHNLIHCIQRCPLAVGKADNPMD
jgi:hypothetical protein